MNRDCDICKKQLSVDFARWTEDKGWIHGHRSCIESALSSTETGYLKKFLWDDGNKGSYSPGWLQDVKRRKIVGNGEVVKDVGRRYFI